VTTAQQRQHKSAVEQRARHAAVAPPISMRACLDSSGVDQRARHAAVARFYAEHAARLRAMVARRVHTTSATVEDACQNAWAILLDHHGLRWLTTVATREAWTQARRGRELTAGALSNPDGDSGELTEPTGPAGDPADLVLGRDEHCSRLRDLQVLKPREREALWLHGLGHTYELGAADQPRDRGSGSGETRTRTGTHLCGPGRAAPIVPMTGGDGRI